MKKLVAAGTVLLNEQVNSNVKRMLISVPEIVAEAQPGQFVHVKKEPSVNFLRRPFSIADVDIKKGILTLIYRIVGKGTAEYAQMKKGDVLSVLGPIGNGFIPKDISAAGGQPLLIGGGVGIAPLIYLSRVLQEKGQKPVLLIGGKNEDEVFWTKYLKPYADKVYVTTDDGSVGFKGFTVQLMPQILAGHNITNIYTCGPMIMMDGIAKLAYEHDIDCQVSMEKRMACGIGVCLGCTFEGKLTHKRRKVCTEGPVFPAREVF